VEHEIKISDDLLVIKIKSVAGLNDIYIFRTDIWNYFFWRINNVAINVQTFPAASDWSQFFISAYFACGWFVSQRLDLFRYWCFSQWWKLLKLVFSYLYVSVISLCCCCADYLIVFLFSFLSWNSLHFIIISLCCLVTFDLFITK